MILPSKTLCLLCLTIFLFFSSSCASNQSSPAPARQTPPLHIPTLYVLSGEGDLDAYHANGAHLWRVPGQGATLTELPSVGTHLLLTPAGIAIATDTLALYSTKGQLVWHHTLSQQAETAMLIGRTLYVTEQTGIVTAWDLHGDLLWQETAIPLEHTFTLATDQHLLFVGGGSTVVALNLQTGHIAWTATTGTETIQQVSIRDQSLLVQSDTSLSVLDTASGHTVWFQPLEVRSLFIDTSAQTVYTVADGMSATPFAPSLPTGLFALSLQTGKIQWQRAFPVQPGSVGIISAQGFLWTGNTRITAWYLQGKQRWQIPYQGKPITSVSSIDSQHEYMLIAQDGTIQAFDTLSGYLRWQEEAPGGAADAYQVIAMGQYTWLIGPSIAAIRPADGTVQWQMTPTMPAAEVLIE
jgi:outer membrane protein assembly factor BamB